MTNVVNVPLKELRPGDKAAGGSINSRKAEAPIDGLIKSIRAHGLLVPLLVRRNGGGQLYVMDGNRRLAALSEIHGKAATLDIPCIEHTEGNALELSLVVNDQRAELHPVDQFEVFAALVEAGATIEDIAKRHNMKIVEVRQALSLGKMAPTIRDMWRDGELSADAAEAFALTSDHKTQLAVLKKLGKHHISAHSIRHMLNGESHASIDSLLKIVGRDAYEAAGFQVNQSLFHDDDRSFITVSDLPALRRMLDEKIEARCEALVAAGWKWAIAKTAAPDDLHAWRRVRESHYTKDQMATLGVVIGLEYTGALVEEKGYVKPGEKVAVPKSPKQKKAETKARAKKQEETGGLSNALAFRLSQQLTAAVREAFVSLSGGDVVCLAVAALAAADSPMKIKIEGNSSNADFSDYYKIAESKSPGERLALLAFWLSKSVNLTCHSADDMVRLLQPAKRGSDHDADPALIVSCLSAAEFKKSVIKHFDAKDYFSSVSKSMIEDAVREALGDDHADRVAKMKAGEARAYATQHITAKTGWVPACMRAVGDRASPGAAAQRRKA